MILDLVGWSLVVAGSALTLLGAIGVLRMPDVFTRMHAAGLGDSLGAALVMLGLVLVLGVQTASARLLLALVFVWFTTPTACHALARSARASGLVPWRKEDAGAAADAAEEGPWRS